MQPVLIPPSPIRRAIAISVVLHAVIVVTAWQGCDPEKKQQQDVVDIELAPPPPPVETLPEEVARRPTEDLASAKPETDKATTIPDPDGLAVDAGVDAPPDAPIDARPDAPIDAKPDAKPDATPPVDAEPVVAQVETDAEAVPDDAGVAADATEVAVVDAGESDATPVASGSGSGTGSGSDQGTASVGSGSGSGGIAQETGSGSGSAGATNEPSVGGAPTTAGTAANLLAYFPPGHTVTAMIRFDRLRGTEWAAHAERLLRPMPDYHVLFGPREAKIYEKLDTLVISTPSPRDATATTLVGHTKLARGALRDFLGATTPIRWSTAVGGLLGKRSRAFPGDKRLFLSPFDGWFLLGQPSDLGGLTAPAAGNVDTIQATGKLPLWLSGIRKIESESGDPRGPALVLTMGLDGGKVSTGPFEAPLGIKEVQLPERISLAMELVKQGWLLRGNIRFKDAAAATAFVGQIQTVQSRVAGASAVYSAILGKEAVRVITNFQFARTGPRVSYTTSISISDTRALMAVAAQYLDTYYKAAP